MAELIDKNNLYNCLFVHNGKVCPNTDIDNLPVTIDVKEVKKAILEQSTTSEAEIKAKAIDEFAEFIHSKAKERNGLYLSSETRSWTHASIFDYVKEFRAEQMKKEVERE